MTISFSDFKGLRPYVIFIKGKRRITPWAILLAENKEDAVLQAICRWFSKLNYCLIIAEEWEKVDFSTRIKAQKNQDSLFKSDFGQQ